MQHSYINQFLQSKYPFHEMLVKFLQILKPNRWTCWLPGCPVALSNTAKLKHTLLDSIELNWTGWPLTYFPEFEPNSDFKHDKYFLAKSFNSTLLNLHCGVSLILFQESSLPHTNIAHTHTHLVKQFCAGKIAMTPLMEEILHRLIW